MSDNIILKVDNVSLKYGNIKSLKNVSIKLYKGEVISLIGANGAGKSSLLKSIIGLEPIVEGEIIFKDEIIQSPSRKIRHSADIITKKGIRLVPEGRGIFTTMTVLENLEMGAYLINDKKYISQKLEFIYSIFPILKDRRKQKAGSLSGGEQQMLSISRALMGDPEVLLLDEPSLGLAPIITNEIFKIIKDINENKKITIIIVEQNAKLALKYSNRAYVMETGNIVLEDESKSLLNNPKVKEAYLGEMN